MKGDGGWTTGVVFSAADIGNRYWSIKCGAFVHGGCGEGCRLRSAGQFAGVSDRVG